MIGFNANGNLTYNLSDNTQIEKTIETTHLYYQISDYVIYYFDDKIIFHDYKKYVIDNTIKIECDEPIIIKIIVNNTLISLNVHQLIILAVYEKYVKIYKFETGLDRKSYKFSIPYNENYWIHKQFTNKLILNIHSGTKFYTISDDILLETNSDVLYFITSNIVMTTNGFYDTIQKKYMSVKQSNKVNNIYYIESGKYGTILYYDEFKYYNIGSYRTIQQNKIIDLIYSGVAKIYITNGCVRLSMGDDLFHPIKRSLKSANNM